MEPLLNFFLIDDSAFDLFIYEKLLIKSGITNSVKTFNSARDALKHLIGQAESLPDIIILLDLQMPDMNGFEFIEVLRSAARSTSAKDQDFHALFDHRHARHRESQSQPAYYRPAAQTIGDPFPEKEAGNLKSL